ncbi:4-amino-4-deoxy-L-arabinose transferase-like glycosyltransferase [Kitasatospora sp. GP30]|uniref:glycosyltransferase family 39 protein n=1 Tax=Kitasatospora sp. GP30 TaxID=3035084 RepID=UPI000C6FCFB7|nr:glycosyltransferase family 39 protein [Kitasatospora sp. GP30]MDH6140924.1 4-amino-4-deoxy-L-arabinose transferase-like glycosyltransferase [Kitasatospora sp. GP30]
MTDTQAEAGQVPDGGASPAQGGPSGGATPAARVPAPATAREDAFAEPLNSRTMPLRILRELADQGRPAAPSARPAVRPAARPATGSMGFVGSTGSTGTTGSTRSVGPRGSAGFIGFEDDDDSPEPVEPINSTTMPLRILRSFPGPRRAEAPEPQEYPEPENSRTMQLRVLPPMPADPDPGYAFVEPPLPGWTLPPVVAMGWASDTGRRRRLVSQALLLVILLVQAALSLRLANAAFEDEALYVYAGHVEIGHLFYGQIEYGGFGSYFSGAPTLYPVLAAAVDSLFGLAGVRAMSLLFMLVATACLYGLTRRLFNERAGLCAAALFSVSMPTLFLGHFATYDAMAVCLLALSAWLLVTVAPRHWALTAPVGLITALAVGVKYASALFLPTLVLLLVLAAYRSHGMRGALQRGAVFAGTTVTALMAALLGSGYLSAIQSTTTARAHGTTTAWQILQDSGRWAGLLVAVATVGSVLYARTARLSEVPGWRRAVPGRRWRTAIGVLLTGTALLAPAYQIHLQTDTSLQKHIGFGLFFAAPMAGVGVTRLMGAHFKFPQWAIAIGVLALTLGMSQSVSYYGSWPDTRYLIPQLAYTVRPGQHWLGDPEEGPIYYLSREHLTSYQDWLSFFYIDYKTKDGRHLSGIPGYRAAVDDGYFDGVVLDYSNGLPAAEDAVRQELRSTGHYRLLSALPYQTSTVGGHFEIWVRQTSS